MRTSRLLFGLLLLAFTAQAQLPRFIPNLPDQLEQIVQENRQLRAKLATADSLATVTERDYKLVFQEKDKRIKALEDTCKSRVDAEYERTQSINTALTTLLAGADQVEQQLANEALTSRLFGIGRVASIVRIREYTINLLNRVRFTQQPK